MRIVIDNGHGGKDVGATHGNQTEAKTNLNVANYLVEMLTKDGHEVLLTNPNMATLDINKRAAKSTNFKARICISVHHNDASNEKAQGAEVIYELKDTQSKLLAECIQAEFAKLNENRGVKTRESEKNVGQDYFGMLRLPKGSANVIAEFAFLTAADIDEINTHEKQKQEAEAIRNGVRLAIKRGLK